MIGQEIQWVERTALETLEFPAADKELIAMLSGTTDFEP